ncbi:hypothetical protein [Absidia glauca]|uniref:Uncharacterized protein n=1 Tax=Absidia glauca TaxID=4829 RepID=A0A168T9G1_ABSGL|nr:hypothetical protein [Absidia glauca]
MSIEPNHAVKVDSTAWPSSYYGGGKRVDLEQFFLKVQQEQQAIEQSPSPRQVRFSPDPPQVHVYEAEYDTFDRLISDIDQSKDTWPSYARRPPQKLDLRPVINHHFVTPERRHSSSSSIIPSTPPLSPSTWLASLDDDDSSDEEEDKPSPILPLSPPPFSPTSLTKKFTSVFRKKRTSTLW